MELGLLGGKADGGAGAEVQDEPVVPESKGVLKEYSGLVRGHGRQVEGAPGGQIWGKINNSSIE